MFSRTMLNIGFAGDDACTRDLDQLGDDISYLGEIVSRSKKEISRSDTKIKRIFDLVFSLIAIVVLSPVLIIATLLIILESRGFVFYKQERIGLNRRRNDRRSSYSRAFSDDRRKETDRRKNIHAGKPFHIYKLRTMRQDAENAGPTLAKKNDSRITRVGGFLRKTRIDEIPQFINVLKGEMSIIGPRPERSFFINKIKQEVPEFPLRQKVKPGITGLAQVEDGYAETLEMMKRKLFFDLKYISQFSLLHELIILFKTVSVVVTGKGAC